MTPERLKEIKHKIRCADTWDESKLEFATMLLETINYIKELEETLQDINYGEKLNDVQILAWECKKSKCPGHIVGLEGLPGFGNLGCS